VDAGGPAVPYAIITLSLRDHPLNRSMDSIPAPESGGGGISGAAARFIATGFYVGYLPGAPGTLGSLWAPILCIALPKAWLPAVWWSIPVIVVAGIWAAGRAEREWGHDPGRVVIDEVAGALLTLLALPLSLPVVWTGFILFRAFDILKPPPIRWCERLPGGWGIMADDIAAGIAANAVLRLFIHFLPGLA
jgi:phosphatidylglycerophosphatase A